MRILVNHSPHLPEGIYRVRLMSVKEQDGQFGKQIVWLMQVASGQYKGALLRAWSNFSTSTHSKAVRWASAFARQDFQPGEEIDLLSLVGREAKACVKFVATDGGAKYPKVVDIVSTNVEKCP